MFPNQVSPFEYVSILVSIILGLGITQLLSALTDLLYHYKKVRFFWPHTIWLVFIVFLLLQDWFITYQLRAKPVWHLPELFFILMYPICLFSIAKMLLPGNDSEEKNDMEIFYQTQYPVIFIISIVAVILSVLFNLLYLDKGILSQIPIIGFLLLLVYAVLIKRYSNLFHKCLAVAILAGTVLSLVLEIDTWVIS